MIKNFYSFSLILLFLTIFRISSIAGCITTQPTDQKVCAGTQAQFSVVASGTSISYQWQVYDKVSTFVNISNDATYSGATSSILIVNTTSAMNGNLYKCVVTSTSCSPNPTTSYSASLFTKISVNPLPSNIGICPAAISMQNVYATGYNLSYKWQMQGPYPGMTTFADITDNTIYGGRIRFYGSTTSNLMINYLVDGPFDPDGTKFRCIVYNSCEPSGVISSESQMVPALTVPPPNNTTVCQGSAAQFTVNAYSYNYSPLFYQWRVNTGSGYTDISDNTVYSNSQTSTLKINSADISMTGYSYMCVVSGGGCGIYSNPAATLTVEQPLLISSQPADQVICSGINTNFSATVTGSYPFYQWQVNKGTGFANLSNDATYSGVYTNTLQISNPDASMDGWQYKLNITSNYCGNTSSNTVKLKVNSPVSITTQPASTASVCEGNSVDLIVSATGTGNTYQWQIDKGTGFSDLPNNANHSGATFNVLTINNISAAMNGWKYRLNVSNCGTVTSNETILNVSPSASITSQPIDATICESSSASFSVSVISTDPPTYQWLVDKGTGFSELTEDDNHSNVTTNTLTLSSITSAMDGWKYKVAVSNTCANDNSSPITLTVIPGPEVSAQPADYASWNGSNATFSTNGSGTNLTYKWQVKKPTDNDFSNVNDGASYNNTNTSTLTVLNPTPAMDGYLYRCIIQSNDCAGIGVVTDEVTLTTVEVKICMATIDETSGKNLIVFEKNYNTATIDSFRIYRETAVTNVYEQIGRVSVNDLSTFEDVNSDPTQQPYIYKIAVNDINDVTSPLSPAHKTMHLTINKGTGNTWNLLWNGYEGLTVNTYNIYRGLAPESMSLINSVSGNITSYTDNNAPSASNIYYQIEIVPSTSCNPTAKTSAFASIKSNKAETQKITGLLNGAHFSKLEIYPNPANEVVTIKDLPENSIITIYDLSGRSRNIDVNNSTINVSNLTEGMYILEVKNNNAIYRMPLTIN